MHSSWYDLVCSDLESSEVRISGKFMWTAVKNEQVSNFADAMLTTEFSGSQISISS